MSAITLGSNISSLQTQRRLGDASKATSRIFQRLSSGLRINRASDDASGLAIASDLSMQARVYGQAIRNVSDGVSLLAIADSAVTELSNIVTRMRELAEQSANGTLTDRQRKPLDAEAQALAKEYSRIALTTSFNGINLFDGSLGQGLKIQLGFGSSGSITAGLGGAKADGTFGNETEYVFSGATQVRMATGDVNGDGITDIISTNSYPNGSYIQLGNGDGTFKTAMSYDTPGLGPNSVNLDDTNGDGILDLIIGRLNSVTVSLGNGNGTFKTASSFAISGSGYGTALRDLNNDGRQDMVIASSNGLYLKFGNGNGTFGSVVTYSAGTNTRGLRITDLNGDGIDDIAAIQSSGAINVYLGNGSGSFRAATNYTGSLALGAVLEIGDLNGDGALDIVTGGSGASSLAFEVRLGNGDGTFKAASASGINGASNPSLAAIGLADLNGDGILDLAAAGLDSSNQKTAWILSGNGNGTFSYSTSFKPASVSDSDFNSLALNDLNGDGVLDLVMCATEDTDMQTYTYLGNSVSGVNTMIPISLQSRASALQAMAILDRNLKNLSQQRGAIGAFDSRLNSAGSNLSVVRENYISAASQIQDTDVAQDSAEFARLQILQQGAVAVLGQANIQPKLALGLLRNI